MPENGAESHPSSARFVGGFAQDVLINNQNHNHKTDKIIARILLFSKNQKTMPCVSAGSTTTKTLAEKDSAKQTRTIILENLTLPKNDNAKENEIILQTQLA